MQSSIGSAYTIAAKERLAMESWHPGMPLGSVFIHESWFRPYAMSPDRWRSLLPLFGTIVPISVVSRMEVYGMRVTAYSDLFPAICGELGKARAVIPEYVLWAKMDDAGEIADLQAGDDHSPGADWHRLDDPAPVYCIDLPEVSEHAGE